MKTTKKDYNSKAYNENMRSFYETCAEVEIIKTVDFLYKHCQMFGAKTLIFWTNTGRISVRSGHVTPTKKINKKLLKN